ncbi:MULTISPECIES: hypothetical protein [unclassified Microcoleus]|uniref:hypothetical protein n=1 Tax=unclassified Microcoleus TaxID=2642155 RepID=UPI001DD10F36|nr:MULTISPECIES: hypothetical protein [unclassified Microcoleus]MCC3503039.1 hypothetical protein [Microcoleus sp. PH2017_19_SFW_U_A]TAG58470.1 MAG: hypothetical protein EAZ28_14600 [Oscillatoriales cyanobacterium]MCC3523539.1 hypothetical protein [Microcoleus sp. PH2017_20_SFW_D_A]MCC3554184.1 hypothetical protein [Microcoleus sp. PH2017_35_SFW_U_B]MCC3565974.1 hypothetical protein [Microcoleus sp. PH2017_31_RDM_U_A]
MYESFFSDKAKKLEQELEKQSFCYFSIEEMPDYFRHGRSKNHCRHRESETLIEKGSRKMSHLWDIFRKPALFAWLRGSAGG